MNKIPIFDFDGPIEHRTLEHCYHLNCVTNPHLSWEDFKKMSMKNFYASFTEFNFTPNPNFQKEYRKYLDTLELEKSIREIIVDLSYDHMLTVITSGSEVSISAFLEKQKVLHLFQDIMGFETHKSKTIKIEQLHRKYKVRKENMVLITDSLGDIFEATEAGVRSIGITWGLHNEAELAHGNPIAIVSEKEKLVSVIRKVLG